MIACSQMWNDACLQNMRIFVACHCASATISCVGSTLLDVSWFMVNYFQFKNNKKATTTTKKRTWSGSTFRFSSFFSLQTSKLMKCVRPEEKKCCVLIGYSCFESDMCHWPMLVLSQVCHSEELTKCTRFNFEESRFGILWLCVHVIFLWQRMWKPGLGCN